MTHIILDVKGGSTSLRSIEMCVHMLIFHILSRLISDIFRLENGRKCQATTKWQIKY